MSKQPKHNISYDLKKFHLYISSYKNICVSIPIDTFVVELFI